MRNRLASIDKIYIWACIIVASNFFGLYQKIAPITQIYFTDMIAMTLLALSLGYLFIHLSNLKLVLYKKLNTKSLMQSFLFIIIIEIMLGILRYGAKQSIMMTIKEAFVPLAMVAIFFSWEIILKHKGIEYIINTLIKVSIVCSVFAIIAYILLDKTGNNFFNLDVNNYSFYRYNKPHFMIGSMIVVPAMIFAWVNQLEGCKEKYNIIAVVLNFIHIIVIGKTRTLITFIIITLVIIYIYTTKKSKKFKLCVTFVCVVLFAIIEGSTIVTSIAVLFADNSVTFRINAINYYMNQIKSYPLFGMGFIGQGNNLLQTLLYGPKMQYYRTDVGFIGFINEYGLVGGTWFILLIIYAYKKLKLAVKKIGKNKIVTYAASFLFFLVISSINLFAIDGFRLVYLPLLMSLISYIEYSIKYDYIEKDN